MTDAERRVRKRLRAALDELVREREWQLKRWTLEHDQQHTPEEWLSIINVWVGKISQQCRPYQNDREPRDLSQYRKRVAQLGAICAAILEATDSEDG